MGTFPEEHTTRARLFTICTLQQLPRLQDKGTEVLCTAFAVQTQTISLASCRGLKIFQGSTGHYYTPHSGRKFMPSGTAVLGFSKVDRDILGGWSAEGSERFTRTAKFKIAQMQSAIAATFRNPDSDQLGEARDIDDLADFLRTWEIPEKSILRTKKILCSRTFSDLERIVSLLSLPQLIPSSQLERWYWTILMRKLQ